MKLLHFESIIDHVKWLFFVQRRGKGGAKAGFRVMLKYFEINKRFMCINLFRYYIKHNRLHVAVRVFSNRSQKKSGKKISDTLGTPRVPLFCFYHILTSSVIYYWTDARQHGISLLNRNTSGSLGEQEMLWEHEPQASVSTAFSSSPKLSRVFV